MTKHSYEEMNSELEAIIQSLQSSDLDLDEALKKYERAQLLITDLEKYLSEVKNKVKEIKAPKKGV